jgi:chromatin remodeling complex protein RSC6
MARGKRVSTKESSETVAESAAAAPAVVPEPVAAENVQVVTTEVEAAAESGPAEETLSQLFTNIVTQIGELKSQLNAMSAQVRTLRTRSERELRAAQKAGRRRRNANRKPSGFVKPALISDELASFLGRPSGSEMARTEVTREIHRYVRAHKLQDPNDGRVILPDAKLRKLFNLKKDTPFSFLNLQKYMTPHFPKKADAPAAAATTTA